MKEDHREPVAGAEEDVAEGEEGEEVDREDVVVEVVEDSPLERIKPSKYRHKKGCCITLCRNL